MPAWTACDQNRTCASRGRSERRAPCPHARPARPPAASLPQRGRAGPAARWRLPPILAFLIHASAGARRAPRPAPTSAIHIRRPMRMTAGCTPPYGQEPLQARAPRVGVACRARLPGARAARRGATGRQPCASSGVPRLRRAFGPAASRAAALAAAARPRLPSPSPRLWAASVPVAPSEPRKSPCGLHAARWPRGPIHARQHRSHQLQWAGAHLRPPHRVPLTRHAPNARVLAPQPRPPPAALHSEAAAAAPCQAARGPCSARGGGSGLRRRGGAVKTCRALPVACAAPALERPLSCSPALAPVGAGGARVRLPLDV